MDRQNLMQTQKIRSVVGILVTIFLCHAVYNLYNKGKKGMAVLVSPFALLGLWLTFFDTNLFSCVPSYIGALTGHGCNGGKSRIPDGPLPEPT